MLWGVSFANTSLNKSHSESGSLNTSSIKDPDEIWLKNNASGNCEMEFIGAKPRDMVDEVFDVKEERKSDENIRTLSPNMKGNRTFTQKLFNLTSTAYSKVQQGICCCGRDRSKYGDNEEEGELMGVDFHLKTKEVPEEYPGIIKKEGWETSYGEGVVRQGSGCISPDILLPREDSGNSNLPKTASGGLDGEWVTEYGGESKQPLEQQTDSKYVYSQIDFKNMFILDGCGDDDEMKKGRWNVDEENKLVRLVLKYNHNWVKIANELGGRSRVQVKDKYRNMTKQKARISKFSGEEDNKIIFFLNKFGRDWLQISEFLVERTPEMIKNRYYSKLRHQVSLSNTREKYLDVLNEIQKERTDSFSYVTNSDITGLNSIISSPEPQRMETNNKFNFGGIEEFKLEGEKLGEGNVGFGSPPLETGWLERGMQHEEPAHEDFKIIPLPENPIEFEGERMVPMDSGDPNTQIKENEFRFNSLGGGDMGDRQDSFRFDRGVSDLSVQFTQDRQNSLLLTEEKMEPLIRGLTPTDNTLFMDNTMNVMNTMNAMNPMNPMNAMNANIPRTYRQGKLDAESLKQIALLKQQEKLLESYLMQINEGISKIELNGEDIDEYLLQGLNPHQQLNPTLNNYHQDLNNYERNMNNES